MTRFVCCELRMGLRELSLELMFLSSNETQLPEETVASQADLSKSGVTGRENYRISRLSRNVRLQLVVSSASLSHLDFLERQGTVFASMVQ